MTTAAAEHWNRVDNSGRVNWWSSSKCQSYYNQALCGEAALTSGSEGVRRRLAKDFPGRVFERAVSIGCGPAAKELALITDGLVGHFDLYEIAQTRIDQGRKSAEALGVLDRITHRSGDVFKAERKPEYDLVYWDHSLHHMSDVDDAVAWSKAVLKPGGVIVINDYVGPNRLQWTPAEVARANAFLDESAVRRGVPVRKLHRSNIISWLKMYRRDPSEAPQSELILAAAQRHLPGVKFEPVGGTFLNILGGVVVPLVTEDSPVIDEMLAADRQLLKEGSAHFTFAIWSA